MELRAYWAVIWRRAWIILVIVAIAALFVGYELYAAHKANNASANVYHSQVTFQLGIQSKDTSGTSNYTDRLGAIDTQSDILANSPILQSSLFDTQVSQQIGHDSSAIQQKFGSGADLGSWQDPKAIGAALTVTRVHGFVTVLTTWNTPAGSWAVANAVGEVSANSIGQYLDYSLSGTSNSSASATAKTASTSLFTARVVSPASDVIAAPNPNTPTKKSTLILILIVALVLGIALAFLVDYLDDSIRSRDEIPDLLQVPVFGEVPRTPSSGQTQSEAKKESVPTAAGRDRL